MDQMDKINHFYQELFNDDFIRTHGFERYRFGNLEFFSCASTLRSKAGREITIAFNIHDEDPDKVELVFQFMNMTTFEQAKVLGKLINQKTSKEIAIFEEQNCVSLVSYHDIGDIQGIIDIFTISLIEISNVSVFLIRL